MEKTFTARDVLTYLFSECESWVEDCDGDCEDGVWRGYSFHTVELKGSLLDELCDMAGIQRKPYGESSLEALARANREDNNLPEPTPPKTTPDYDDEIAF
jgi:hypothetical protein